MKTVFVICCTDQDGYSIPVCVGETEESALRAWEDFKTKNKDNSYWDVEYFDIYEIGVAE